jgi:hypothetical protein
LAKLLLDSVENQLWELYQTHPYAYTSDTCISIMAPPVSNIIIVVNKDISVLLFSLAPKCATHVIIVASLISEHSSIEIHNLVSFIYI